MVKELGADGLRAAHYPHDDETYAECDRQGLLVWCEYPNLGYFTPTAVYRRNALQGIREMIAQLGSHPSIIAWSVSNEYIAGKKSPSEWLERLLREFTAETRRLAAACPEVRIGIALCRAGMTTQKRRQDFSCCAIEQEEG